MRRHIKGSGCTAEKTRDEEDECENDEVIDNEDFALLIEDDKKTTEESTIPTLNKYI